MSALRVAGVVVSAYLRSVTRPELMDMTSVADGRTHTITFAEFERGVMVGTGHYRAICGADVMVASMAACPGPRCPQCVEHQREIERAAIPPGLVVRLARRVRVLRRGGRP